MASATTNQPQARATGRHLHVSPYKVRQVLELIRGLPVEDAERVLQLCEKDAADVVYKLVASAAANAEHNHTLPPDELFVAGAWADEGPTRKWGQPRARGRYFRIRKRTSHVTIVLERFDVEDLEARRRRDESSGRGAAVQQRRRAERVRRSRATQSDTAEEEAEEETVPEEDVVDATTAEVEAEAPADSETEADADDDDGGAEDAAADEGEEE